MTLLQAMQAAQAALQIVTDSRELQKLHKPLADFKAKCPYLGFEDYDMQGVPFRSELAYVVTNTEGKPTKSVRRVQRSRGREDVVPPLLKIETHNNLFNTMLSLDRLHTDGIPHSIGQRFAHEIQRHIVLPLLYSAEQQEKVVFTTPEGLEDAVRKVVEEMRKTGPCSVVYSPHDWERLKDFPRPVSPRDGLEDPMMRPSHVIADGIVLVIRDAPEEVGFVMEKSPAMLYAAADDLASMRMSALGLYAFCVWGDAPVVKIDTRPRP